MKRCIFDDDNLLAEFWDQSTMSVRLQRGLQRHWYRCRATLPVMFNELLVQRRQEPSFIGQLQYYEWWPITTANQRAMYAWQLDRRAGREGQNFGATPGIGKVTLNELAERFDIYQASFSRLPLTLAKDLAPEHTVMVQEFLGIAQDLRERGGDAEDLTKAAQARAFGTLTARQSLSTLLQIIVGLEHARNQTVDSDPEVKLSMLCFELDKIFAQQVGEYIDRSGHIRLMFGGE